VAEGLTEILDLTNVSNMFLFSFFSTQILQIGGGRRGLSAHPTNATKPSDVRRDETTRFIHR